MFIALILEFERHSFVKRFAPYRILLTDSKARGDEIFKRADEVRPGFGVLHIRYLAQQRRDRDHAGDLGLRSSKGSRKCSGSL